MTTTIEELEEWMQTPTEHEHLEFKEAKHQYSKEEVAKYCSAFANEGGGKLVLGVTDAPPRTVIGSRAFAHLDNLKIYLRSEFGPLVEVEELKHPDGRVLIMHVSNRPLGKAVMFKGAAWRRVGGSLMPMTSEELSRVFQEDAPDFSAELCRHADSSDLAERGVQILRAAWRRKAQNERAADLSDAQLLADLGLLTEGRVTNAALLLLGTPDAVRRCIPQAELVFEYRQAESNVRFQQRLEFREGFLLYQDRLWEAINSRNEVHHLQAGFFVTDIPSFSEKVVREGILNAVSHRAYRSPNSIFVRQSPQILEIVSPGGFPAGITAENILWRQSPRNRLLSEVLNKCGLVERSGQGVDLMFDTCIREGKPRPDFFGTDAYEVHLKLRGEIQDVSLLRFLEQVGKEKQFTFSTEDLLVLDLVHRDQRVSPELQERIPRLLSNGILERRSRARYIFSQHYYQLAGKQGEYTRKRGLNREENKTLLLKHIRFRGTKGAPASELRQVLTSADSTLIRDLLQEMKRDGLIHSRGKTRAARWYPGRPPSSTIVNNN